MTVFFKTDRQTRKVKGGGKVGWREGGKERKRIGCRRGKNNVE